MIVKILMPKLESPNQGKNCDWTMSNKFSSNIAPEKS